MAYRTDGSSHTSGIKNEEDMRSILEAKANLIYPELSNAFQVVKKGGTTYKEDIQIIDNNATRKASLKKKEDISKGSFDYVNSSSVVSTMDVFKPFRDEILSVRNEEQVKGTAKLRIITAAHNILDSLTGKDLKDILKNNVSNKNKDMKIIISEKSSGKNWAYDFKDCPLYDSIENHHPRIVMGDGIDSAKIVFLTKDGSTLDHGIRIRVVTNNGIGALIGKSKANSTSVGVIKIQQDNVANLIDTMVSLGRAVVF